MWCALAAIVIGGPWSAWILVNLGGLVRSSNVAILLFTAPAALLLTHEVVSGALGITTFFALQLIWWTAALFIATKAWNLVGELK